MKWKDISLAEENFTDNYEDEDGGVSRHYVLKPDTIHSYQAYITLRESFGAPNSLMFDDDKTQWQYALQSSNAFFEIYDWKISSWSIAVYVKKDSKKSAEEEANELLKLLEHQSGKNNPKIKEKLKKPDGLVIENPYVAYRETADSLYTLLLEVREVSGTTAKECAKWMRHLDLCRGAFIMYLSSVEAFINLLYELYLKKDLREKRVYDRLIKEQVDLKIRLAPVYCECFNVEILDSSNDAFRNFHSIANLRNNLIHANLTPQMMNSLIYEDDFQFVVESDSTTSIGIPNNLREFQAEHIDKTKQITDALFKYVIDAMKPRLRKEFLQVLELEYIQVEFEDGQTYIV